MRKVAVVAVLAVVAALGWFGVNRDGPTVSQPAVTSPVPTTPPTRSATQPSPVWTPTSSSRSSSPSSPASSTLSSSTAPATSSMPGAEHAWEPTVRQFGSRYGDPARRDVRSWSDALKPYVTKAVYDDLRRTDPSARPRGRYDSSELLETTDTRAVAEISYVEGWSLVVYLQPGQRPGSWEVSAYDGLDDEDSD